MQREFNFTKAAILELPVAPPGKRVYYRDAKTRGLALAVTDRGTKTYVFYRKIDRRPERISIGRFDDLSVEQARNRATELNAAIALGQNPADKRRSVRDEMTLQELFDAYLERHAKPNKRFWHQDLSKFNQYVASGSRGGIKLSSRRVSKVARADIAQLHSEISKKHATTANRVLALLSSVFSWAIRSGLWDQPNPAKCISKNRERSRDRFLQADELPRFFKAVAEEENATLRDYLLISLLTGARENNVLAMQWDQLNLSDGTWYIPETKNGTPHLLPLTPEAVAILKARQDDSPLNSKFVFAGRGKSGHMTVPKKGWYRVLKRAGIQNLRIHDLRRTLGSWQASTGASLTVIGKTLNHKHVSSTAIYARLAIDPVRKAMETATRAMRAAGITEQKAEVLSISPSPLKTIDVDSAIGNEAQKIAA